MGPYYHLTIADYPTFAHKNGYYHELMNHLFQPTRCQKWDSYGIIYLTLLKNRL